MVMGKKVAELDHQALHAHPEKSQPGGRVGDGPPGKVKALEGELPEKEDAPPVMSQRIEHAVAGHHQRDGDAGRAVAAAGAGGPDRRADDTSSNSSACRPGATRIAGARSNVAAVTELSSSPHGRGSSL